MASGKDGLLPGFIHFHSEIERLVRRMISGAGDRAEAVWRPLADVFVSGGKVVVRLELAGVTRENIDLTYREGELRVRGGRPGSEGPEDYWLMEMPHGRFERVVEIPLPVDPDGIEAVCKDGLLEIRLPIAEKSVQAHTTVKVT